MILIKWDTELMAMGLELKNLQWRYLQPPSMTNTSPVVQPNYFGGLASLQPTATASTKMNDNL